MMEQRRALIIPFAMDKDNLVENPFIIPTACFSSECGKLERQVSWTAIAGCTLRENDTMHKNGSVLLGHNHAAMVTQKMNGKKPCLILKDVLKTEQGKTYLERIKKSQTLGNTGKVTHTLRESEVTREDLLICKSMRSSQREAKKDANKSATPKCNQKTTPPSSPSQRFRRNLPTADDECENEEKDIEEIIVGKDKGADYKITEVVVSWEPAKDTDGGHELSPLRIKNSCTHSEREVQRKLKRKREDSEAQCNGRGSPKRNRESVLRLPGEDESDGVTSASLEDMDEDRCIVQFTVGGDDRTEVPIISPTSEAKTDIDTQSRRLSHSQVNKCKTNASEPIVLSSDDEENSDISQHCSPAVHTLVTEIDTVIHEQASQVAVADQHEAADIQDMQVLHVVVHDPPSSVTLSPTPITDDYCMGIAFSTLHCGGYQGKANGDIVIEQHKIIVPLKDTSKNVEVKLTLERKELSRYSVWEQEDMEAKQILFKGDKGPFPAAVLLLCVSEAAAAAVKKDLRKLCNKQDGTTKAGKASPFILVSLKDPLQGMEGALLRSLLDIDCLNSLSHEQSILNHGSHTINFWESVNNPVLTLDESIDLIRRTGLDSNLLSLLDLEMTDPEIDKEQNNPHPHRDKTTTAHISLENEPHKESVQELETTPEQDTSTKLDPDEDQKEQLEHSTEKKKEEPTSLYTLCHRRTKGSFSVSLCKPTSSWTKYKHQGLTDRLIQFPPPPLKGGITVTLEDLQCLDSGQFLNDVIIDFYLKYLVQNASAVVAERSHIFSSFFYKQLTRRDNASEGSTSDYCQRQRRHQRVKTWTRHVDIFEKDFLFVPVNQEAHWYLVVICFPGLNEPKVEAWTCPDTQAAKSHSGTGELQFQEKAEKSKSPSGNTEFPLSINHSVSMDTEKENAQDKTTKDSPPGPVNCTEQTCQKKVVCKRPCILIMDSLKLSLHERVFKLLREYLQSEWEARRGSLRDFGPDQMKSSHCQVPLQDNSSDCGLYLLQYVESFLKDPVVHFILPLHLERWFPRQKVRRKRDEIRDLVLNLYRRQNLDENR